MAGKKGKEMNLIMTERPPSRDFLDQRSGIKMKGTLRGLYAPHLLGI